VTANEILSSFSKSLIADERILNLRERELIQRILQSARVYAGTAQEAAVNEIVARAVGETVAQRAYAVLGGEIIRRMLEDTQNGAMQGHTVPLTVMGPAPTQPGQPSGPRPPVPNMAFAGPAPTQPGQPSGPRPPVPNMSFVGPAPTQPGQPSGPRPPVPNMAFVGPAPTQPGQPSGPRPPVPNMSLAGTTAGTITSGRRPPVPAQPIPPRPPVPPAMKRSIETTEVAVMERPEFQNAQFVVLEEFLAPEELKDLTEYALAHEAEFSLSEVIAPGAHGSNVDYEHRRSRVLMDAGKHQNVMLNRIQACLPIVMQRFGREVFPVKNVEVQITASNDGDFFRHHSDSGQGEIETRELTFVYFFNREPRAFDGGELMIYDTRLENGEYCSAGEGHRIVPGQNQIVFFPSSLVHEITPVQCASKAFGDSRFTVNGWFHR
jgi:SM-20-related protein